MTDLAAWPNSRPAYTCKQFRRTTAESPSEDGSPWRRSTCVEERDGRKEHVMMDADGPGAIVRIWSANPAGTLRFYLDGADQPALQAKMSDLLGGNSPGLPRPIAGEYSKGWTLYFPIYANRM
jgi:hypothetical protein